MVTKITPPRTKGERANPTQQATMYQASVAKLAKLVERKNTTRAEYLRWLVDCAEAGLVGPTADLDKCRSIQHILMALDIGDIAAGEAYREISQALAVVVREERQSARLEALDNWTKEHGDA